MEKTDLKLANRVIAIVLLAVFVALYYMTTGFPRDAAVYPQMLLVVGMVFCAMLLVQSFTAKKVEEGPIRIAKPELINMLISIAVMIAYLILLSRLGYAASTFLFIIVQAWLIRRDCNKLVLLAVALGVTAVLTISFGTFLNVWLPKGILF